MFEKMKKIISAIMILYMTLALAACSGKQMISYRSEQEQNGLKIIDTMTLDVKGDKVVKITEVIDLDMSGVDEGAQEQMTLLYDALVDQYEAVDDVTCTGSAGTNTYTITIIIDATGNAVNTLASRGLLEIGGNESGLSLKAISSSLEADGYIKIE